MKFVCLLNFISVLCTTINSQKTFLDSSQNIRLLQTTKLLREDIFEKTGKTERVRQTAREKHIVQDRVPEYVPFPCDVKAGKSSRVPTSVHKLKPGDIDIVAAMGDSLIAGFGALSTNLYHLSVEYRGVSYLGGGEGSWREYLTIPNILKEFNPELIGYAKSDSFAFEEKSEFNLGTTGATSSDLPLMAERLVERIKTDSRVDVEKHWKFISIMIGANDFCSDICYLPDAWLTLSNHKSYLTTALRILRDNLPRTFVSISPPPHIKDLYTVTGRRPRCPIILSFACPCIFGRKWNSQRSEFFDIMTKFQLLEGEIANHPEFQRKDFAVVVQPFTINLKFPTKEDGKSDLSYLAADCLHVTQKGYARAANSIWNTLFEPVGQKTTGWIEPFEKFNCPTSKRPFFATLQNSQDDREGYFF
ncbi:phospholipase B1, membrane-associated-like [Belonocnema kinseyi]|uniref:phospholipase B1, membrane-associated-like n=1 Tax=Belonocnema kinseyi TaxID=2817044 RepID=UPI00143D2D15|nr:phospholipase B1, membrane-associated-like [Belonocnema kinseyi]XP_033213048.1 phospholipase B1, membrane-associated-like [Belonocnema kinseyi]